MREQEICERAFAMPPTNPAYPMDPYRFHSREYLIITYRTDPRKLHELVPEPLQIDEPLVKFEFIRMHAGLERLWRLHRKRTGHSSLIQGPQERVLPLHVS